MNLLKATEDLSMLLRALCDNQANLWLIYLLLESTLKRGGVIYTAGNGGSYAQSAHLTSELIGRFKIDRNPYASIQLGSVPSTLTAVSNDYSFDSVFVREFEALVNPEKDLLVCFSTSGTSPNLINLLQYARINCVDSVAFLGRDGGTMKYLSTYHVLIESFDTARIQETHLFLIHELCQALELNLNTK